VTDARPARPRRLRPALALAVVAAALAAGALSSPGRAVIDSVREAIGIERAEPALFSLPAPGSILVTSDAGAWIVASDGSKRFLGPYAETSWSPFGRFVVGARANELVAMEPDGDTRWKLARRGASLPRWAGTEVDTRIAYLAGGRLRVVGGDGRNDTLATGLSALAPVAPAWAPGAPGAGSMIAVVDTSGRVTVYAPEAGAVRWRSAPGPRPTKLEWSSDGHRLLALSAAGLRVYDLEGRIAERDHSPGPGVLIDATFVPGTHEVALLRRTASDTEIVLLRSGRLLFRVTGELRQLLPSPDRRWLLVTWPTADQWVFVPTGPGQRIRAVANISSQFEGGIPRPEGWCCSAVAP
jgi:hypothetical protein